MEIFGAVQPLVMTLEGYESTFGEDDPEELSLMQMEDKMQAQRIANALQNLYFMEVKLTEPSDEEGLSEEIGTEEDLLELRRIAAAVHGKTPEDYHQGSVGLGFQFNQLINHTGTEGYYLPVKFPQAFFLEELAVGSSLGLLAEMDALEPVLAEQFPSEVATALTNEDDEEKAEIPGPVGVWHSLRRLCRSSLELNLPIHLG